MGSCRRPNPRRAKDAEAPGVLEWLRDVTGLTQMQWCETVHRSTGILVGTWTHLKNFNQDRQGQVYFKGITAVSAWGDWQRDMWQAGWDVSMVTSVVLRLDHSAPVSCSLPHWLGLHFSLFSFKFFLPKTGPPFLAQTSFLLQIFWFRLPRAGIAGLCNHTWISLFWLVVCFFLKGSPFGQHCSC